MGVKTIKKLIAIKYNSRETRDCRLSILINDLTKIAIKLKTRDSSGLLRDCSSLLGLRII